VLLPTGAGQERDEAGTLSQTRHLQLTALSSVFNSLQIIS
jgi:hypothetical protein